MNYKLVIKILLLISWMTLIFGFSNQDSDHSSEVSDGLIYRVSKTILGKNYEKITKSKSYDTVVLVVRKSAHAFVYFVLSLMEIKPNSLIFEKCLIIVILVRPKYFPMAF